MTHVSRKWVKKDVFERMTRQFIDTISELRTKQEIAGFVKELLTPTERIMLAKRLAVILMLEKGYPCRVIERTLKVSPSTSIRFWKMTKIQRFNFLTKDIKSKEAKRKFWEGIEELLRAGMPPRGRGRWRKTLELLDRE